MTEPEKQCSKCLAFKPLSEFHNNKSNKDGKKPACKYCTNEARYQYRAANPEKARESDSKYRAANREKVNEDRRQRRAANPEKYNEAQRQRRAANPEKYKEYARQHRAADRHARNQCAVFNALDPKKWELLKSKLKAMDSTKTKEKE